MFVVVHLLIVRARQQSKQRGMCKWAWRTTPLWGLEKRPEKYNLQEMTPVGRLKT